MSGPVGAGSEAGPVVGIILAGGRSRRMGRDKALLPLGGTPLLARIIARARPQTEALALSAHGDPGRYDSFGLLVLPDPVPDFAGPLAGILAGLDWAARAYPDAAYLASFACDAPFFPRDLVARLVAAAQQSRQPLACAESAGRLHPVFGLWSVGLRETLRRAVIDERHHRVGDVMAAQGVARVAFAVEPFDPFFNINRPEDLIEAERIAAISG